MGTEISRKELRNPILCSNPTQSHLISLTGLAFEDAAEKSSNVPSTPLPQARGTQTQQETSAWFLLCLKARDRSSMAQKFSQREKSKNLPRGASYMA